MLYNAELWPLSVVQKKLEKVASAKHCNLRADDLALIMMDFNYEARMHQPINSTHSQPPLDSITPIFSQIQIFWQLVNICRYL